jgi:hypothetical protein
MWVLRGRLTIPLLFFLSLLSNCTSRFDVPPQTENFATISTTEQTLDFSIGWFSIKAEETAMETLYSICYETPDGEITKIVDLGPREQPLIILGERIFYLGGGLCSVDFYGNDKKIFDFPVESGFSMGEIIGTEGDYILCEAYKSVEIYNDPNAVDGFHTMRVDCMIKSDFSDWYEVIYDE